MSPETPKIENKESKGFIAPIQWAVTEVKASIDMAKEVQEPETNKWAEDVLTHVRDAEKWIRNIKESLEAKEVTPGLTDQLSAEGYDD